MLRTIRSDRSRGFAALGGLTFLVTASLSTPEGVQSQDVREVVSKEIAVSRAEAALRLGFEDGEGLKISFQDGEVLLNGERVGSYTTGPLETAWRSLLGQAVALDDGPLADALMEWEPPSGLEGEELELARALDARLEEELAVPTQDPDPERGSAPMLEIRGLEGPAGLGALLGQGRRLSLLGEALDRLDVEQIDLRIGEDVVVEAGERIDASLVVVGADAEIFGTVDGNVVVVDGRLLLGDGSEVMGDIRLAEARLVREGGAIGGRVRTLDAEERASAAPVVDAEEIRRQIEDDVRDELRSSFRAPFRNPLRYFFGGIAGIIQNLITFAMLAGVGLAIIYFARPNLEVVAEVAQQETLRSAMVGTAGAFLLFPVWILGILALVVSVIGIPVAIAWIPLFPLAAGLAACLGYLAVAMKVGEWISRRRIERLDWVTDSNPFYLMVAGLGALMAAFVGANIASMAGPFLGFIESLLTLVGALATMTAALIGFGAVLLTRGGRQPTYSGVGDLGLDTPSWRRPRRDAHLNEDRDFGASDPFAASEATAAPEEPVAGAGSEETAADEAAATESPDTDEEEQR